MFMSLIDLTKPVVPAVTLIALKEHLRIDGSDEDTLLLSLIDAATKHVETKADTKLIQRQVRYSTPYKNVLRLPIAPLVSLDLLEVRGADGEITSVALDGVIVDIDTGAIDLRHVSLGVLAAQQVRLTCTVGYGSITDDLPAELAQAVLLQASHMYEARGLTQAMSSHPMVEILCTAHQRPCLS
jgi:uncharacterized phiE125 gp8 family phage protein